jgi:hypothetical protein
MRRFHVSIADLLVLVLSCGIALAALRSASEVWASLLFTFAVGCFLVAVPLAVYRRAGRRAYWLGFAIFGWAYLLLGLIPEARSQLATTRLSEHLLSRVFQKDAGGSIAFSPNGERIAAGLGDEVRIWDAATGKPIAVKWVDWVSFGRISHTLFSLLLALIGGVLTRHLASPRDQPETKGP